ncbi:hypothetical protein L1994_10925 [Methanomicrobium antiquum]|uniref:Uncharacterized protein n=1 Tax=Methanomicrobium antiquum TaxID=487686 RepID=A0AAF0JLG3_9EURY|nr:hypothetical protein [Methanomicrobium antiquum]WFN36639.1 hypothetical protein L1994_10925 [Methanomicrobium antiquum]
MPREKIIAGGLEGDGIEGHKKRSGEKSSVYDSLQSRDTEKHSEDMDSPSAEFESSKTKKRSSKTVSDEKTDIFESDFGSVRSKSGYKADSSIGSSSDIFSNGFGSKDAGWMSGRKAKTPENRPGAPFEEKAGKESDKNKSADIFETKIAKNPLEPDSEGFSVPEKSERASPEKNSDPFYTGFGYSNQREKKEEMSKKSPKSQLGMEPDRNAQSSKKKEKKNADGIDDEDDLFS